MMLAPLTRPPFFKSIHFVVVCEYAMCCRCIFGNYWIKAKELMSRVYSPGQQYGVTLSEVLPNVSGTNRKDFGREIVSRGLQTFLHTISTCL